MRSFFQSQGIECQRTCVFTPQQNGVVERKHRHILVVEEHYDFNLTYLFRFGENVC